MTNVINITQARSPDALTHASALMTTLSNTHLFHHLGVLGKAVIDQSRDPTCIKECTTRIQDYDVEFATSVGLQGMLTFLTTLGSDLPEPLLSRPYMTITQDYLIPYEYVPLSQEADILGVFKDVLAWANSFGLVSELGHVQSIFIHKVMATAFVMDLELIAHSIVPNNENRPYAVVFQHNDLRISIQMDIVPLLDHYQAYTRATQVD